MKWNGLLGLFVALLLLGSCNKGPRLIPDAELIQIVREVYLSNAYVSTHGRNVLQNDSVDIYTPIFDRHGYSPADLRFTVDNLSKRKSVRFSDIIEEATKLIEKEMTQYDKQLALIDTVDARIDRRYAAEVYADSAIHATRVADTSKLRFHLPVKVGNYRVEFSYRVDTTDKNSYLQYNHYLKDSVKNMTGYTYRSYNRTDEWNRHSIDFEVKETTPRTLYIDLGYVSGRKPESYGLQIDSLRIQYFLSKTLGRDSLLRELLYVDSLHPKKPLVGDEKPQDFVTLRADTARVDSPRDSLVRR